MGTRLSRRDFLGGTAGILAGMGIAQATQVNAAEASKKESKPAQSVFPRWRGFNLLYLFTANGYRAPVEDDFRWASDWGFDNSSAAE